MKKIELLSPVGDFECLKAAVQNGADSVYLGASSFSARASAKNFDLEELKEAIKYAKLRNVNVHLTLNTLVEENELDDALNLANAAYSFGIDAIIVQDFGLATLLIKNFPDLNIHASTQMTIHNLEGALEMEKLGFKRVVLSRELSIPEISNICHNTNIEIETFIHGALCISYSGRCYMSSLIGGRSGNRGKCAQSCRLPYKLYDKGRNLMDKGYLLSPRDLCSLNNLPELVNAGIDSFKIEGRMKNPEYVATVTRIYRKYFDKILKKENYIVDQNNIKELMQVFNRGGFSSGHLTNEPNKKLIYSIKPNNIGLYLGKIKKFDKNKGYITLIPEEEIEVGDSISVENENTKYTISELTENGKNIPSAKNQLVTIGRMKGNIKVNDSVYKLSSKKLSKLAQASYQKENKKIKLNATITIKANKPVTLQVSPVQVQNNIYENININIVSDIIPEKALNQPLTVEKIEAQLKKTGNTEFEFKNIEVNLDDGLYIKSISSLNEFRRTALLQLEEKAIEKFTKDKINEIKKSTLIKSELQNKKQISILLNKLNLSNDYKKISEVEYIYIPLHYYLNKDYYNIIKQFKSTYVYLPTIIRQNKIESLKKSLKLITEKFNISGFVISNLSDLSLIPESDNFKIVGNYTLNVFNNQTINELSKLGFDRITQSLELPEADSNELQFSNLESIVYGRAPSMTLNYCLLGKSNHCYKECQRYCEKDEYILNDRMNFDFPISVNNTATITTIYNSKITSILPSKTKASIYRIDILDESINEINNVIDTVRKR